MNTKEKEALLRQIENLGRSVSFEDFGVDIKVNENLDLILDRSSGKTRIRNARARMFNLTLSQPEIIAHLSPFEVRCLWCKSVISYPCWSATVKFDRNTFLFFVCFSEVSPSDVKLTCR